MSHATDPASRRRSTVAAAPRTAAKATDAASPAVQRQFVNFAFYKLDPAFRRITDHDKLQARSEFLTLFQTRRPRPHLPHLQHRRPQKRHRFPALADRDVDQTISERN